MPKWTPDQKEAIWTRDCQLLVGAGAGSGKTAVLVERIVSLITQERRPVNRLLVMTFTRAAAAEMKERIGLRLEEALKEASLAEDQAFLQTQLDRLPGAQISTIHSFCQTLVRSYADSLDLDPNSAILDPEEEKMVMDRILEQVMDHYYDKEKDWFVPLVSAFSYQRDDQGFRQLLVQLYHFLRGLPRPQAWLDKKIENFYMGEGSAGLEDDLRGLLVKKMDRAESILGALDELVSKELPYLEKTQASDRALVEDLVAVLEKDLQGFLTGLSGLSFARKAPKKKGVDNSPEAEDAYQEGRKVLKEIFTKELAPLADLDLGVAKAHSQSIYQRLLDLEIVLLDFWQRLDDHKKKARLLTFDDLEHGALKALEAPAVAREVQGAYDYLFVDEYQDTSYLQEAILLSLAGSDNLFMVGDVKQSIYRFRKAAPEIFLQKKADFRKGELGRLITLKKNFRSSLPIVTAINHLFSKLMDGGPREVVYDETEELDYGGLLEGEDRPVELHILEKDPEEEAQATEDLDYQEREASVAAQLILEAHQKPFYDHKLGQMRPMDYRDMVVLLRASKGTGDSYLKVFNKHRIPVYMDKPSGYFDAVEILVLKETLKLVDNKEQDLAWVSFLRSPMVGADDEILARTLAGRDKASVAAWLYGTTHHPKIERAKALILDWQEKSDYLDVGRLVERILQDTNWLLVAGAMESGDQRQANLRLFLHRAQVHAKSKIGGLSGFLQDLEIMEEREVDPGLANSIGEKSNVVRILTVHRSKGLEYPLVLLGGLGKGFNRQSLRSDALLFHPQLGIGPDYADLEAGYRYKMVQRLALEDKLVEEGDAEELRILYVAATRARNKLILLGGLTAKALGRLDNPHMGPFLKGRSFADWLYPLFGPKAASFARLKLVDEEAVHLSLGKEETDQAKALRSLMDLVAKRAGSMDADLPLYKSWPKEARLRARLPGKLGVTDVYRLSAGGLDSYQQGKPLEKKSPDFLMDVPALGAARGLAMHAVMQHLNLDALKAAGLKDADLKKEQMLTQILAQVEDMLARELLSSEQAALVDGAKIAGFFLSPLGQRVLASPAVYREYPFNLEVEAGEVFPEARDSRMRAPLLLQGVMDMVFEEDGQLVLLDYKTDRIGGDFYGPRGLFNKYKAQLGLYKRALELLSQKKVSGVALYLFSTGQTIDLDL